MVVWGGFKSVWVGGLWIDLGSVGLWVVVAVVGHGGHGSHRVVVGVGLWGRVESWWMCDRGGSW